jgi:hypothetical protein
LPLRISIVETNASLSNKLLLYSAHATICVLLLYIMKVLENSSALLRLARDSGCTIIHVPINFEPGHDEISDKAYGILAGVKEGNAFTRGEWGADFSGTVVLLCTIVESRQRLEFVHIFIPMK